jgi:hypothetical protein
MDMTLESFLELLRSIPYRADLTPETLKFASGKAGDTMPGSLYFESGRIRLAHKDGPKISKHERIRRYSLSASGVERFQKYKQCKLDARQIEERLKERGDLHSITLNKLGTVAQNGERLIEFFEDKRGKTRRHLSRGGPIKKPVLNQVQINLIALAADSSSKSAMMNIVMKAVYSHALSRLK